CAALSLIADNAWNGGIVLGAPRSPPTGSDLDGIPGRLSRNGKPELAGKTDDPMGALAFLANLAADRGQPLRGGMVAITGGIVPTVGVGVGEGLEFTVEGVGDVAMGAI